MLPAELESESTHLIAQVLRVVLRTIGRQEHSNGGDEQRFAQGGAHAPQIRPEGIHLQATGLEERAGKGEAHFQRPRFHAGRSRRSPA